jgi:hypothetical protein
VNSRDAFKSTLQVRHTGRPVFVPFIYGLAARIEQVELADMVLDPTYYANLLEGAHNLLKSDAIITNFDPSLEAEIFGGQVDWKSQYELPEVIGWSRCELGAASLESSQRIPIMLEATRRLVQTRGKEVAIVGVISGPCSLARMVADHAQLDKGYQIEDIISLTGNQLTKLTRSLCDTKVDAIIIREDLLGGTYREELLSQDRSYTGVYTTMFNVMKFYNVAALVMVEEQRLSVIEEIARKLRPNGIILGAMRTGQDTLGSLKDLADSQKLALGLPIPIGGQSEMLAQFKVIDDFVNQNKPRGFFYTSDGEIPQNISLEVMRDLVSRMKGT